MTAATEDATGTEPADYLDNLLVLIGTVRAEKARDPLRRLEDRLLEIRLEVTGDE